MATTDSNGLIQYQTTDNVVPLQTAFNGLSSSVSTALNSTVRTFKVATDTERNALATSRPPTASNPLVVFNSASGKRYHEINTGSGWSRLIPEAVDGTQTIASYQQAGQMDLSFPAGKLPASTPVLIKTGYLGSTTGISFGNGYMPYVTFDTAFPTAVLSVQVMPVYRAPFTSMRQHALDDAQASSFRVVYPGETSSTAHAFSWLAVGY